MTWASLGLWTTEEQYIKNWLVEALYRLAQSNSTTPDDEEIVISGKLRPFLFQVKKERQIIWNITPEASNFANATSSRPDGHPDFKLLFTGSDFDQYEYDIECKLVRINRKGKYWDYCKHYVTDGIVRFSTGKYAKSTPAGSMIGYVQEGDISCLFQTINTNSIAACQSKLECSSGFVPRGITHLSQQLVRSNDQLTLFHMWLDLR